MPSIPFLGQIMPFGGNFAIRGWAKCDGQLLPISANSALFSLLGTTYGGDGRTTFALPDLRGRTPINPRQGPGLSAYDLGQKGGVEHVILNTTQIPSHTHGGAGHLRGSSQDGTKDQPSNSNTIAKAQGGSSPYAEAPPDVTMSASPVAVSLLDTGGDLPHENRQPWLSVNYLIALQGTYPSRS